MIWTLVVFFITFLVLRKYAFGPLAALVEKRRTIVRENLEAAERSRDEAEQLLEEYKQQLAAGASRGGRDRRARAPHGRRARAPDARGGHGPARARHRRRQGGDRRRDAPGDRSDQEPGRRPHAARDREGRRPRARRGRGHGAWSKRRWPRSTSRSSGRSSRDGAGSREDGSTARRWRRPRRTAGRLHEVARDLAAIGDAVAESRDLSGALFNPAFPARRQEADPRAAERRAPTRSCATRCFVLVDNERLDALADVVEVVREADRRARRQLELELTTAVPDRRRRGRADPRQAGRGQRPRGHARALASTPSILGGVIVRVRDRMVDLSVRGRLEALRLSLRNARLGSTGGES